MENQDQTATEVEAKSEQPVTGEKSSSVEIVKCPSCGRQLLTKTSRLCNWCGEVIGDEAYQKRAEEQRLAADALLKSRIAAETKETARYGVLGRLKKLGKDGVDIPDLDP